MKKTRIAIAVLLVVLMSLMVIPHSLADKVDLSKFSEEERKGMLISLLSESKSDLVVSAITDVVNTYDDTTLTTIADIISAEMEKREVNGEKETTEVKEKVVAQKGDKNGTVKEIQEILIALGYLDGSADGDFGNKTLEAVTHFQRVFEFEETGIVTESLYEFLKGTYDDLMNAYELMGLSNSNSSSSSGYTRVTAKELSDAYFDNTQAADNKYTEKIIEISGEIESIMDLGDYYHVRLRVDKLGLITVLCEFSHSHEDEIDLLDKGDKVVIRGKCLGLGILEVLVVGCQIV